MYSINRIFGISSQATHYEYRCVTIGEYGDRKYKTFRLTSASMRRVYKMTKGWMSSSKTKQIRSYSRYFPQP